MADSLTSRARSRSRSSRRASSARAQPRRDNSTASSRPIPLDAPVMIARFTGVVYGESLSQLWQLHALSQDGREEIADFRETVRHRPDVEFLRIELFRDLFPLQRCGDGRAVGCAR